MPENTVYVGRGSRWGNPYVVGKDGTAEECIKKYSDMLFPYSHESGSIDDFFISASMFEDIVNNLRGKNLACWCALDSPCHADLLLEIANKTDCIIYANPVE